MHSDRLLKLAAFLRELPPERFDFCTVRELRPECGAVGCAIGWTPEVFPELVELDYRGKPLILSMARSMGRYTCDYVVIGHVLFGITFYESEMLFGPQETVPWMRGSVTSAATASQVAESIEAFVKWKEAACELPTAE